MGYQVPGTTRVTYWERSASAGLSCCERTPWFQEPSVFFGAARRTFQRSFSSLQSSRAPVALSAVLGLACSFLDKTLAQLMTGASTEKGCVDLLVKESHQAPFLCHGNENSPRTAPTIICITICSYILACHQLLLSL